MNTADVLERAADVIVERGWWDGKTPPKFGQRPRVCALGAIAATDPRGRMTDRAFSAIAAFGRHVGMRVDDWNDDPSRTADEVIAALRECAAAERAKT